LPTEILFESLDDIVPVAYFDSGFIVVGARDPYAVNV